ncbi:MAG TPA: rhomboid family intramembrane serine protease [Pirellulales bacterium]|nr:rhomboid family intramembrane serine protease [Pirellulales bacterium]
MIFPFGDDVPARRPPIVTCAIIVLNVLALVWVDLLPDVNHKLVLVERGFIPVRLGQGLQGRPMVFEIEDPAEGPQRNRPAVLKKQVTLPADRASIVSSLVTSLFLHGGWLHLLGNMWFLWIFGNNVEDRLGHFLYVFFYLGGGVLANLCHWWSDPASQVPVIGASGAVATVLGAYAVTWPWAHVRCVVVLIIFITVVQLPALAVLGFWFLTQVLEASQQVDLGLQGGVAFWAHIGGFLAGMVLMPLLARRPEPPPRQPPRPPLEYQVYGDRW